MFGWCSANQHNDCIKKYRRFYIGKQKVKRKTVEAIIWLDEWRECDCYCHSPAPVEKKTRNPRRKK